jgi:cell division protein ZapA
MSDSEQTKSIRVQILGRKYALRVREEDEAHTRRVAASLDARMQQFSQAHPEQAELTTAVMTALSLAEELCLQREQYDDSTSALTHELDQLAQRLAEAAPDAPDEGDDAPPIGENGTP